LYQLIAAAGMACASHSRVRLWFTLIFTSLGERPIPELSPLLMVGGTAHKNKGSERDLPEILSYAEFQN